MIESVKKSRNGRHYCLKDTAIDPLKYGTQLKMHTTSLDKLESNSNTTLSVIKLMKGELFC